MSIKNGKVVGLGYSLTNSKGEVIDQAGAQDPFVYMHGSQQIVPGLESALEGLKVGDKKKVTVSPEEGYGEKNEEFKLVVNRSQFPQEMEIEEGMEFRANSPDGEGMAFRVELIQGDQIHIDGNHPLAGETLNFDVEVLEVRDATEEEQQHGHAHGPGGHGHDHHDHADHDSEHDPEHDPEHDEEE